MKGLFVSKLIAGVVVCLTALASLPVAADTILYMNSTRGSGTGVLGNFRSAIADSLDNHAGGSVFDVTFVQNHVAGNLAAELASNPNYDQIWFDTTILNTNVLDGSDLAALNSWASVDQPEFILDSSFFFRNKETTTTSASSTAVSVNEALALQATGSRGILIGTDHNQFAGTANAILSNFGFDGLFTGSFNITPNANFVGSLLLGPEAVDTGTFFTDHLQTLSTSNVPIGTHVLNANGGDRTIEVFENLFSNSPTHVSHIGASFSTGTVVTPIPAPPVFFIALVGLLMFRKR